MPSLPSTLGLVAVIALHAAIAAVSTRFFRVRLATRVGTLLYVLVVTPIVLVFSTLFFTGTLGIGPDLGGTDRAVFVTIVLPMAVGLAVDYVWMPPPEEALPETAE